MTIKKTMAVGFLAAGLMLGGCGSSSGTEESKNADGTITLRFAWWGNEARNEVTNKAIAKFEEKNPTIKVQAEPGDWGGYWDKLATQVAGNDTPDVIQMDEKYLAEYGNRGVLLDLEEAKVSTADFAEGTVDTGRTTKGLFGINAGINAPVVLANPSVLKAAGVTAPDDKTWTWQQLADVSAQVTKASPKGTFGSQNYGMVEPMMRVWLRQNGADEYTTEGVGFTAEQLAPWFQEMLTLQTSGAFPTASEASEDTGKSVDQTMAATNKVAFSYYWSNQVNALSKASGQKLQLLRPPSKTGKAVDAELWYKASMLWSASSQSKNTAAAAKLIDFLANDPEAGEILGTERGVPANTKVREAVKPSLNETDKMVVTYLEDIEPELGGPMVVTPVGGSDIQLGRYGQDVIFKRSTPQQAAQGLVDELKSKVKV